VVSEGISDPGHRLRRPHESPGGWHVVKIQLWPPAETMMSSSLRLHCSMAHGYWVGDLRDVRALRREHALMHSAQWADPDVTPHSHPAGQTGLSWVELTDGATGEAGPKDPDPGAEGHPT
jgi:hypothetical protein